MKAQKKILIIASIELLSVFLWKILSFNFEMLFMLWIILCSLITIYSLIGKPEKNACWETPDHNLLDQVRNQFTILKIYNKVPSEVRADMNFDLIIFILLAIINVISLAIVSII